METVICTNFTRSAYKIFLLLDTKHPRTHDEIKQALLEKKEVMLLGARNTLAEFLESLCCVNEVMKKNGGYVLTANGVKERDRLAVIVRQK